MTILTEEKSAFLYKSLPKTSSEEKSSMESDVLLNIDWVRNVEQCFHMADLQEGHCEEGWGNIHCVMLNWWYTVTLAGKGW